MKRFLYTIAIAALSLFSVGCSEITGYDVINSSSGVVHAIELTNSTKGKYFVTVRSRYNSHGSYYTQRWYLYTDNSYSIGDTITFK